MRRSCFVADGRGEEFQEMLTGFVTGYGDDGWHGKFPTLTGRSGEGISSSVMRSAYGSG